MFGALFPVQLQKHWINTVFLALGIFLAKEGNRWNTLSGEQSLIFKPL